MPEKCGVVVMAQCHQRPEEARSFVLLFTSLNHCPTVSPPPRYHPHGITPFRELE